MSTAFPQGFTLVRPPSPTTTTTTQPQITLNIGPQPIRRGIPTTSTTTTTIPPSLKGELWQHPTFPWNSRIENNEELKNFIINSTITTNRTGIITAVGNSTDGANYTLEMYRGALVSISRRYEVPNMILYGDHFLHKIQDALISYGTGWKYIKMQEVISYDDYKLLKSDPRKTPPSNNDLPIWHENGYIQTLRGRDINGVEIIISGFYDNKKNSKYAIITYKHIERRNLLRQMGYEAETDIQKSTSQPKTQSIL